MISFSTLIDPRYLTSSARCTPESRNTSKSRANYYMSDPLQKPAMWIGNVAEKLGLVGKKSFVDLEDFDDAFYGFIPRSLNPKKNLEAFREGTPSKEDQISNHNEKQETKKIIKKLENDLREIKRANPANKKSIEKIQKEIAEEKKKLSSLNLEAAGRRPGMDLTFSAPKSVSLLYAHALCFENLDLVKTVEAAQAKAVKSTMALLEREFILSRERVGLGIPGVHKNSVQYEKVQGILAAMFHHFESREVGNKGPDPQVHTHVALMNDTEGMDGEFKSAFMDHVKENLHGLGAAYRSVLAQELRAAGIPIVQSTTKEHKVINFEVDGLEDHIQTFSKRSQEIQEAFKEKKIHSKAHGAVLTRSNKKEKSSEELLEAWTAALCKLNLQKFDAKAISKKYCYLPRSNDEIKEILFNMETHFSTVDLRRALYEEAQFVNCLDHGCFTPFDWVEKRMKDLLNDPDLIAVHDPKKNLADRARGFDRFGNTFYASKKIISQEQDFYSNVIPSLVNNKGLTVLSESEIDKKIAEIELKLSSDEKAFKLQDFQKEAVKKALLNPSQLSIQIAGAGFGKTTAAIFTKAIFESKGFHLIGCAPSNTAAQQLAKDLNKDLGTCAPLVEAKSVDKLLKELDDGKLKLNSQSVVMVDEAGMVGFKNYYALMQYVQKADARIILMGDHKQLNSVGMGDVLRRLKQRSDVQAHSTFEIGGAFEDYRFISRQKTEWMKQAAQYAALGCAQECWDMYEKEGLVTLEDDEKQLEQKLCSDYLSSSKPVHQKMILASTNQSCKKLNDAIREELKKNYLGKDCVTNKNGLEFREKDYLMVRESFMVNSKDSNQTSIKVNLAKNSKLTVIGIDTKRSHSKVTFETEVDGKKVTFTLNGHNSQDAQKLKQLGYAYAVTVHKSQGATVDEVFYMPSKFVSQELFYVATSRHRENLKMYAMEDAKAQILANASSIQEKQHAHDLQRVASCVAPVDDLEKACLIQDEQAYKAPTSFVLESIPDALDYVTFDDRHVYIRNSGGLIEEHAFEKNDDPVLQSLLSKCSGVCPSLQDLKLKDEERKQRMGELCARQTIGTEVEVRNGTVRLRFTERMDAQAFEERIEVLSSHARWDPDPDQMDQGWWVFKSFQSGEKYLNSNAHPEPNLPAWSLLQEAALDAGSPTSAPSSAPIPDTSPASLSAPSSASELVDPSASVSATSSEGLSAPSSASELVDPSASVSADQSADSSADMSAYSSASFAVQSQGVVPRENSDLLQPLKETDFFAGKGHFSLGFPDNKISQKSGLKTTWSLDQDAYQAIRSSGVKVKLALNGKDSIKLQLIDQNDQFIVLPISCINEEQKKSLKGGQVHLLGLNADKKPFIFEKLSPKLTLVEKVSTFIGDVVQAIPLPRQDAKPLIRTVEHKPEPARPFIQGLEAPSMKTLREGRWIKMATTVKTSIDSFDGPGVVAHSASINKGSHCLAAVFDSKTNTLFQVPVANKEVLKSLKEVQGWPVTFMKDSTGKVCGLDLPEMKTNWESMKSEQRNMTHTMSQFRGQKSVDFEILRISNDRIYFAHGDKHPRKALVLDRSTDHPTLQKLQKIPNATLQLLVGTHCHLSFSNGKVTQWVALDPNHQHRGYNFRKQDDLESWWCENDEVHRANVEEQRRAQREYEWSQVRNARSFEHPNNEPEPIPTSSNSMKPNNSRNQGFSR